MICHPEHLGDCHPSCSEGPASRIADDPSLSAATSEGAGGFSPLNEANPKRALALDHATAPQLLAATFVDQKFPHRAPSGARIIRAFFGTGSAEHFATSTDKEVADTALAQLITILGPLPTPDASLTTVRRWPRSLPQYEVGHLDRMATLDEAIAKLGDLTLLGNGYRGVGLPDLIQASRNIARALST
jgi:protoporphyrinogen oxidase